MRGDRSVQLVLADRPAASLHRRAPYVGVRRPAPRDPAAGIARLPPRPGQRGDPAVGGAALAVEARRSDVDQAVFEMAAGLPRSRPRAGGAPSVGVRDAAPLGDAALDAEEFEEFLTA